MRKTSKPSKAMLLAALLPILWAAPAPAAAKPAPPAGLEGIFAGIHDMEGAVTGARWEEASRKAEAVREDFKKLLPELRKSVPVGKLLDDFTFIFQNLERAVEAKDEEKAFRSSVALQRVFHELFNTFSSRVPPVFAAIHESLGKAQRGAEAAKSKDVTRELAKVEGFIPCTRAPWRENGQDVAALERFAQDVESLRKALKTLDPREQAARLSALKDQAAKLQSSFK